MEQYKYFNVFVAILLTWFLGFKSFYLIYTLYNVYTNTSTKNNLFVAFFMYFFGYVRTIQLIFVYLTCTLVKNWNEYYKNCKNLLSMVEHYRVDIDKQVEKFKNLEDIPPEDRESFEMKKSLLVVYDIAQNRYMKFKNYLNSQSLFVKGYELWLSTQQFLDSESFDFFRETIDGWIKMCVEFMYNKLSSDERTKKYIDHLVSFISQVYTYMTFKKSEVVEPVSVNNDIDSAEIKQEIEQFKTAMMQLAQFSDNLPNNLGKNTNYPNLMDLNNNFAKHLKEELEKEEFKKDV